MASERITVAMRMLAVGGASAVAAWAAHDGLYANSALALLIALWTGGATIGRAQPVTVPSPPPAPVPDQDERRRLLAYLDLSPAPLIVGEAGVLSAVNRAARRLFLTDAVIPSPPQSLVEAMRRTPPGRTASVTLEEKGTLRTFALAAGELRLGGQAAQVGALIDIGAEIKAAEAAALRELVQILSHEIVNALTPIASLAETAAMMIEDDPVPLPAVREAVVTVARRAAGLQRFGDAYRSLARLPVPEKRRIATADLLIDLARLFAARWPAIHLIHDGERAPPVIHADADQLVAALWALLQNAAEATGENEDGRVELHVTGMPDAAVFTIINHGDPIPPSVADTMFQPFMTTKATGSGVGLALARQILRGHGGDVSLQCSDRTATRFVAVLPHV